MEEYNYKAGGHDCGCVLRVGFCVFSPKHMLFDASSFQVLLDLRFQKVRFKITILKCAI